MNFSFLPKQRFFFRLRCYGFVFQFNFFVATISLLNSNFQLAVSADNVSSQIFTQTFLPEIIKRFIIIPVPVFRSFQHSPNRCRHYIIMFLNCKRVFFTLPDVSDIKENQFSPLIPSCLGYKGETGFGFLFFVCDIKENSNPCFTPLVSDIKEKIITFPHPLFREK